MPPFSLQKSTTIASKINLGRHQFFDGFLHRFFIDFCSIWEANLAPCWPHFPSKWGDPVASARFFVGSMFFFIFFAVLAPSWRHLGSIWEGLGLDFGRFWALFWKLLATIWAYDYSWKTCSFDPFCWRLVLDGLVGLREAQRISMMKMCLYNHVCLVASLAALVE